MSCAYVNGGLGDISSGFGRSTTGVGSTSPFLRFFDVDLVDLPMEFELGSSVVCRVRAAFGFCLGGAWGSGEGGGNLTSGGGGE